MLEGLIERLRCDVGIAITGLAFEGKEKHPTAEVGDIFLCVFFKGIYHHGIIHIIEGDAGEIYIGAMNYSLKILAECMRGDVEHSL